jgi:hypothetical protein
MNQFPSNSPFSNQQKVASIPTIRLKRLVEDAQSALDHEDISSAQELLEEISKICKTL